MSRDWTQEELQVTSEAMRKQGNLTFDEFKIAVGLQDLEDIMSKRGDSKKKLADAIGTSRQNVSQIFKGDQYFTVKQIRIIAKRYNMTPQEVCSVFALL